MPNNIKVINEAIAEKKAEDAKLAAETFDTKELVFTDEDRAKMAELEGRRETVITETAGNGTMSSVPIDTYMAGVENAIQEIKTAQDKFVAKEMFTGDIKKSAEEIRQDAQKQSIAMFRNIALDGEEHTDDDIIAINNKAIAAIQEYLKVDKLEAGDIIRKFRRMTMRQMAEILPKEFMEVYVSEKEILANNYAARERLLTTIGYLSVTGPELDYLNDYIDHEHKLMMLSNRLVECQLSVADVIKSKESLVEMAKKAEALDPHNMESPWTKYIKGDARKVHSEFAQNAVVLDLMKAEYEKLLEEYKDDPECAAQIQEQIDECTMKHEVYLDITNLTLLKELWAMLSTRLRADKRGSYKNLEREAIAAMDRIRRAKQNVSFPIYSEGSPGNNKAEVLYRMYMNQYPAALGACNETIKAVREKDPDGLIDAEDIQPIELDGIPNQDTHEMFAVLLLILFGRIMKRLTPNDQTKYQAIQLDLYFTMYCKLISDVYLMDSVWTTMKDFVQYCVQTWPAPRKGRK